MLALRHMITRTPILLFSRLAIVKIHRLAFTIKSPLLASNRIFNFKTRIDVKFHKVITI